jgi:hypothetical protein
MLPGNARARLSKKRTVPFRNFRCDFRFLSERSAAIGDKLSDLPSHEDILSAHGQDDSVQCHKPATKAALRGIHPARINVAAP